MFFAKLIMHRALLTRDRDNQPCEEIERCGLIQVWRSAVFNQRTRSPMRAGFNVGDNGVIVYAGKYVILYLKHEDLTTGRLDDDRFSMQFL